MGEWVSVEDRLPNKKGYYIVTHTWGSRKYIDMIYFRGKTQWARNNNSITHWMPLPEPPKES